MIYLTKSFDLSMLPVDFDGNLEIKDASVDDIKSIESPIAISSDVHVTDFEKPTDITNFKDVLLTKEDFLFVVSDTIKLISIV